jgi:regulator of extracellular matrix RemA (YlzA/DUF370 family)
MTAFIPLGQGGWVARGRVLAIAHAQSAPIKRLMQALEPDRVLNLTYGYPRESVLLLDNGFLALVSVPMPELLALLEPGGPHESS